jgi:hypothetical protein
MDKKEPAQCPKCDRPATTYRFKAGEKNWICGNGHNWTDAQAEQAKNKETKQEVKTIGWPGFGHGGVFHP